jgi:hypothetical protein
MTSLRCPACGKTVEISGTKCPACRTKFATEFLSEWAKSEAATPAVPKSPAAGGSSPVIGRQLPSAGGRRSLAAGGEATKPARAAPEAAGGERSADLAAKLAPPPMPTNVTRRTSWLQVCGGIGLLLGGVACLISAFYDNSHDQKSRRVRLFEDLLGETGTELVGAAVLLGAAGWAIGTSRKTYTQASPATGNASRVTGCDLCGQESADVSPAFLSIYGGFEPFTAAFRCAACDRCIAGIRRLRRFALWQIAVLLPGMIVAPLLLLGGVIWLFKKAENENSGLNVPALVLIGSALGVFVVVWVMQRHLKQKTKQLLGPAVESRIQALTGIRKWGWPRRIGMARDVEVGMTVIEL